MNINNIVKFAATNRTAITTTLTGVVAGTAAFALTLKNKKNPQATITLLTEDDVDEMNVGRGRWEPVIVPGGDTVLIKADI